MGKLYYWFSSILCRADVTPQRFLDELYLRLEACKCLHGAAKHMELSKIYHRFIGLKLGEQSETNNSILHLLSANWDATSDTFTLAVPGIRPLCEE